MSAQAITLDSDSAKAGSGGSSRIDSFGKFKGTIKHCKQYTTESNAKFVEIYFSSDGGQETKIRICTHSKVGEPTYGFKQLQAVMACCKVRTLTPIEAVIDDYDYDQNKVVPIKRTIYKELSGKQIGLALYRHDQTNDKSGKDFYSMEIAAPFHYDTEQVAAEVLDSSPAALLEKIVAGLRNKDSRQSGGHQKSHDFYQSAQPSDNFDDDIPF